MVRNALVLGSLGVGMWFEPHAINMMLKFKLLDFM
jgi:hypothetical protein